MKVLLSCAPNGAFEALPDYLTSALRRLGHEVLLFDHRGFLLPGRIRSRIGWIDRAERTRINARLLALARSARPDIVVVNQGTVLEPRTIEAVRERGIRCVNWFSDFPAEFERGLETAPAYDAFYLGSSYAALRHAEAGHLHAHWLPFACDPEVHRPVPRPRRGRPPGSAAPVVFVGSYYPERQVLLRFLRGLPVGVWGPGWERAAGDPDLAPMLRGGSLRPAEWVELFASARAVLNIHYGALGPRAVSGDMANTRVFEILGCGAYQIVNRQADALRLFREGQHLDGFSSGEELREAVERALADRARARRIALAGREAVLRSHTYEHRALRLLSPAAAGLGAMEEDVAPRARRTPLPAAGGAGR
ncbi:MAG: glycosyltransferase [Acidobacteriota bacterium]